MIRNYRFANLSLESALVLPELAEFDPVGSSPDNGCTIRVDRTTPPVPFPIDDITDVRLIDHDAHQRTVGTADGTTFLLDNDMAGITVRPHADTNEGKLRRLLLDQVLPRLLDLRGSLTMHASGVAIGDGGILFVGPSGVGKSTLAASFHDAGHGLVGDDCFIIDLAAGSPTAQSTYRSLRLHADSYAQVYGGAAGPDDHVLANGKTQLATSERGHPAPLPLAAIVALDPSDEYRGPPRVQQQSTRAATIHIVKNSFRTDVRDRNELAHAFERAEELSGLVPVYALEYERRFDALDQLRAELAHVVRGWSGLEPASL